MSVPQEKVTVNVSAVDLGMMELLVANGYFRSRSALVRRSIAGTLNQYRSLIDRLIDRERLVVGSARYERADLERLRAHGKRVAIRVVGSVSIADDVPPELANATIVELRVFGALRAPNGVLAILGDRVVRADRWTLRSFTVDND